jgi:hypothetical protein
MIRYYGNQTCSAETECNKEEKFDACHLYGRQCISQENCNWFQPILGNNHESGRLDAQATREVTAILKFNCDVRYIRNVYMYWV